MNARLAAILALGVLALAGCSTPLGSWLPSIPVPHIPWFHSERKLGPLPAYDAKATAQIRWQVPLGKKGGTTFAPALAGNTVYAAGPDGTIVSVDQASGKLNWRVSAGKPLSSGIGADASLVVVGTDKGEVLAFDASGKAVWQSKVSSEVAGPPKIAEGVVVVWSLDGRIFGLSAADGSRRWVYERTNPPLTVRRFPGGSMTRGAVFTGTAGGKLLAIDYLTGTLGWEGNVATPKGATELERIADITSLPMIESRQVCAIAYRGRLACFEPARGTLIWSRDFSSLAGMALDNRHLYVTDDKGAVHALDTTTGASVWNQDKLATRFPSGPVIEGDALAVVDAEGYLHLLDRNDGSLIGRSSSDGSAPLSQPMAVDGVAYWQTDGGNLISAAAR